MRNPRSILITGASSGIGEALALHYAAANIHLTLTGRDKDRLAGVGEACRAQGAHVRDVVADVTDQSAMTLLLEEAEQEHPFDLVIANAGISAGAGGATEPADQARRIFRTNLDGVVNTVLPALDFMRARNADDQEGSQRTGTREKRTKGQIAIMASVAGFRGFPSAPAYCGSKAAVRVWGEGLRGMAHGHGVEVNVICPGYVRSRMTARNDFPMPFLMDADKAARIIARCLARNKGRIVFPLRLYVMLRLVNALPMAITDPLLRSLPGKAQD